MGIGKRSLSVVRRWREGRQLGVSDGWMPGSVNCWRCCSACSPSLPAIPLCRLYSPVRSFSPTRTLSPVRSHAIARSHTIVIHRRYPSLSPVRSLTPDRTLRFPLPLSSLLPRGRPSAVVVLKLSLVVVRRWEMVADMEADRRRKGNSKTGESPVCSAETGAQAWWRLESIGGGLREGALCE